MANGLETHAPGYRWIIEALVIVMLIVQVMAWLAPAPILAPIVASLHIGMGQFGLIISIISLCIGIFSFLGGVLIERFGALRTLLLGIWLLALGEVASGFTAGYGALILCRVVEGVGYGLMIGPPAALVMEWFNEGEWPYINTINSMIAFLGLFALFAITPRVFHALGSSWQKTLTWYGISAIVAAILWTAFGRQRRSAAIGEPQTHPASNFSEVLRMRGVILMSISLFGGLWVFQIYTSFLPEFFREYRGLGLEEASTLTGLLPLSGIFAAGLGGLGSGMAGLRKPFLWPLAILSLIGYLTVILLTQTAGISAGLVLVGIGASGGLAATGTLMMELPGMTPAKLGLAFATIWAVGYTGGFISPILGGQLVPLMGLRNVLLLAAAFQMLPVISMYMLPETGPGRRPLAMAASAAAH
ncbi:MAG: MFS transporter [Deltaproteobacteria bacterium]|nr:MFS transporter [Deltaproteobacteria bacterium]